MKQLNLQASLLMRLALVLHFPTLYAQNLPLERRSDWSTAGRQTPIPDYSLVFNIQDFGGKGDSATLNETAFQQAVLALQGKPGVIYFPEGKYLFHQSIQLRDSLIVRGAGADKSVLFFDLGSVVQNCIVANGTLSPEADAFPLTQNATTGDTLLQVQSNLKPGDFVRFQFEDSLLIFSDWARGNAGQLFQVVSADNHQIQVNHPLRLSSDLALNPRLRPIDPIADAGLECLKIKRLDGNVAIGSNLLFHHALRCWLVGIESETCNFAHFSFDGSAHCEIFGCYAHDAFAYGGGGQGYGLVFQYTSGDNRAQNNIFRHLRHAMLLQSGANGNVLAYNFSSDPYWVEFPNDGAGEIVLHGNYPSYNLFEGNICENIRPDGSHGNNGPLNTLFRNRTTGYGLIVTGPQYQPSLNILANEIVPGGLFQGLYLPGGTDIYEQGNSQDGTIVPAGSTIQSDSSLFFSTPPSFLSGANFLIGPPAAFNTASNPAKDRYFSLETPTDCSARAGLLTHTVDPLAAEETFELYPNPAVNTINVGASKPGMLVVYDLNGTRRLTIPKYETSLSIDCKNWPAGLYFITFKTNLYSASKRLIISPKN